jgi:dipeptidyl aminopeptidase/acylaminoacyl peptidase
MKKIISIVLLALSISAYGQKKNIDHSVYDDWKSVGNVQITDNGQFSLYQVNAQEGDGYLVALNLSNLQKENFPRGNGARITPNGEFALFTIKPLFSQTKEAKIKKSKPDQMPKDTLAIYNLKNKDFKTFPYLKGFKMAKWGNKYLAFQTTPPADTSKGKKPVKKDKDEGSDLFVYNLNSGIVDTLKYVAEYDFSRGGDTLFYVARPNLKDSLNKPGLYMYNPANKSVITIIETTLKQSVKLPEVSEDNTKMVFFAKLDTTKKNKDKNISILEFKSGMESAKILLDNNFASLPKGMIISENRDLAFNKEGTRLFFGIAPILPEKDTTNKDPEVAKLDIWHYAEPYIQPMQLRNLQREMRKSYLSKIELDGDPNFVQLAKEEYENVIIPAKWSYNKGIAVTNYSYRLESQWDANPKRDLYIIDITTGTAKLVTKGEYMSSYSLSPEGNFFVWYNNSDKNWYSLNIPEEKVVSLTEGMNISFADELHDSPSMASSYGNGGWTEEDKAIFIYDRYDIWKFDPTAKKSPLNFTEGKGKAEGITFRITRPDRDFRDSEPFAEKSEFIFTAFNNKTKESGFYSKDLKSRKPVLKEWTLEPFSFSSLKMSKTGKELVYVKANFSNSPDIWISKENFKNQIKVSDINPQQKDYNWGTVELVNWKSATGIELEGLLYKPENFDPSKKYPMLVYFYERNSHLLYSYRAPAPSRSTINIPYFVSNEYIVFIPDIAYEIGHPGKSAIDCIVPGVKMLCENSWVDSDNVAIQGQSWGGYQVAYMITKPETFKWKAGGAGAPVSNMTSAYGGIRWGSGMVRQFQYEHTQSRIGKTLWEAPELYIENSPLFFADKVETPLLIMHNDADDAVPWYQGIEYFTALRRLGKPVWMLQYNNEVHNLSKRVNAKDLSIRLAQFFDHYLKGAPMPVWMKRGVPASLKGIDYGYDLTE